MADNGVELRSISWSETFPFVRLFRAFRRSVDYRHLVLALAAIACIYLAGRLFDGIWKSAGGGVMVLDSIVQQTELHGYAILPSHEYAGRAEEARARWREVRDAYPATDTGEARDLVRQSLDWVDARLNSGLAAIDADTKLSAPDRAARRDALVCQADYLRILLAARGRGRVGDAGARASAVQALLAANKDLPAADRVEQERRLDLALNQQEAAAEYHARLPRGPFAALLNYEMQCFGGAVHGAMSGNWLFAGSAFDPHPSMLGSIVSSAKGILWAVTQRPLFSVLFGLTALLVFAFFGGAICRSAAIQEAREDSIGIGKSLEFAREKIGGFLLAPLMPLGILLITGFLILLGSLAGAIPVVGEVLSGLLFVLALLGGFALAFMLLALVLGFHLMWPTIAAEGSDGFDAASRAASYLSQRAWHIAFYSLLLLLYGGACFVVVRLIAMLVLKLTHLFSNAGMSVFGSLSSAMTDSVSKLDAMWHMPAWSELPLLPSATGPAFWGEFGTVPLSSSETLAMWLIAIWVFTVVSLVGAFVISFYYCGSVEMYFLLRRDVDAVDFDEVYYEEGGETAGEPQPAATPAPANSSGGRSLPVVGNASQGE